MKAKRACTYVFKCMHQAAALQVLAALELAKANQRPTPASTGASTQERGQSSTQPCAAEQPSPAVTPSVPEDPATPPTEVCNHIIKIR